MFFAMFGLMSCWNEAKHRLRMEYDIHRTVGWMSLPVIVHGFGHEVQLLSAN